MSRKEPPITKGQRFKGYPEEEPRRQVFIEVQRVARDASWADIAVCTWAVMWRKRMPLRRGRFPFPVERFNWDRSDLTVQQVDWERARPTATDAGRSTP